MAPSARCVDYALNDCEGKMKAKKPRKIFGLLGAMVLLACQHNSQPTATSTQPKSQATPQATAATRSPQQPQLSSEFLKAFRGTINNDLPILLLLKRAGEALSGAYVYEKRGDNLDLSGQLDSQGGFRLEESVLTRKGETSTTTGVFLGKFTDAHGPSKAPGRKHKATRRCRFP
jgi:hypothetical protein